MRSAMARRTRAFGLVLLCLGGLGAAWKPSRALPPAGSKRIRGQIDRKPQDCRCSWDDGVLARGQARARRRNSPPFLPIYLLRLELAVRDCAWMCAQSSVL